MFGTYYERENSYRYRHLYYPIFNSVISSILRHCLQKTTRISLFEFYALSLYYVFYNPPGILDQRLLILSPWSQDVVILYVRRLFGYSNVLRVLDVHFSLVVDCKTKVGSLYYSFSEMFRYRLNTGCF